MGGAKVGVMGTFTMHEQIEVVAKRYYRPL